jgi:TonB family protein
MAEKAFLLAALFFFWQPVYVFCQEPGGMLGSVEVVSAVSPRYPPLALAAGAEGRVPVDVIVDVRGQPVSTKSVEGHALLRKAAEDAALLWRFNPTSEGGAPREVRVYFDFRIEAVEATGAENTASLVGSNQYELIYRYSTVRPLERVAGSIPERKCPLHAQVMKLDVVPVSYGCPAGEVIYRNSNPVNVWRNFRRKWAKRSYYEEVQRKYFPESNARIWIGGETDLRVTKAETLYCPKCREVEAGWCKRHPAKCY